MRLSLYLELKHRIIEYVIDPAKAARTDPHSYFVLQTSYFVTPFSFYLLNFTSN